MADRPKKQIMEEPLSGHSTQAEVSARVAEAINNGRLHSWFATEFNPIRNGVASNPHRIFAWLDNAAKTKKHNRKSKSVAGNLQRWVHKFRRDGLIGDEEKACATRRIKEALQNGGFHPRVYYLDEFVGAEKEKQPYEYVARNRSSEEDDCIDRILPPRSIGCQTPKVQRAPRPALASNR